jgi:hypothetical protein
MTTCCLGALLFWTSEHQTPSRLACGSLFLVLALLSKEAAIALPFIASLLRPSRKIAIAGFAVALCYLVIRSLRGIPGAFFA